jgi:hypothetical protein
MKEIRIAPTAQLVLLLVLIGAGLASLVGMWPEIQRYMKIRSM